MKTTIFLSLALAILGGCTGARTKWAAPEPFPLVEDFRDLQSPLTPADSGEGFKEPEEPAGEITLREALLLALVKNPELRVFSWELRAREAAVLQAGLLPNPELDIELEDFAGSGELRRFDGSEATIQLGQLIELGGKRAKRKRVASLHRDLAGWNYEIKRLDVYADVTKAFVDVLGAQEHLTLSEELIQIAQKALDAASTRVREGRDSPVEISKAQVTLYTTRIEKERFVRELERARRRLAAMWGSSPPAFTRAVGVLDSISRIPSLKQLDEIISNSPDVARWSVEIERRRAEVSLAESGRIPDLTINGGVKRLNEIDENAFVLGLSMPLPFFNRNQGGVLESRYRLSQSGEEKKALSVKLYSDAADVYKELVSAYVTINGLKGDVLPAARKAYEMINEGYRKGKFSFLALLDAQRTLFEVKNEYIEALVGYHRARADLERLIGQKLDAVLDRTGRD